MELNPLYSKLFNAITDTIENLKQVQREVEDEYIKAGEDTPEKVIKFNAQ